MKSCLGAVKLGGIKGLAHITGGGLPENLPRVLPDGIGADLDAALWPGLPVFAWLKKTGDIADAEMFRSFNCGVGMAVVAAPDDADTVAAELLRAGEMVRPIGRIVERGGEHPVEIVNAEALWRV